MSANSVYVVKGFGDVEFLNNNKQKKNDYKVVVISYSLLQKRSAVARALTADAKQKNSGSCFFKCIIADEMAVKDETRQRARHRNKPAKCRG